MTNETIDETIDGYPPTMHTDQFTTEEEWNFLTDSQDIEKTCLDLGFDPKGHTALSVKIWEGEYDAVYSHRFEFYRGPADRLYPNDGSHLTTDNLLRLWIGQLLRTDQHKKETKWEPEFWQYIGDVNPEHGGTYFRPEGWGYYDIVSVTDLNGYGILIQLGSLSVDNDQYIDHAIDTWDDNAKTEALSNIVNALANNDNDKIQWCINWIVDSWLGYWGFDQDSYEQNTVIANPEDSDYWGDYLARENWKVDAFQSAAAYGKYDGDIKKYIESEFLGGE